MWLTSSSQPISTTRSPPLGSRPVVSVSRTISRMSIRGGIVRIAAAGGKGGGGEPAGAERLVPNNLVRKNIRRTIMPLPATDKTILGAIERLTHEEHALYKKGNLT